MKISSDKAVLITGASSGIGEATARLFLQKGFTVYATARRVETLSRLESEGARVLPLDVTEEDTLCAAVQRVEAEVGAVGVLVNNAGYGLNGPLEELSLADVQRQFETNVFGLLRLSQLVLPAMRRAGRGRIVNVGSVGGSFTAPGAGAYHATKYAVEALSDALRMETAPFGVHVALVKPTGVRTAFAGKIADTLPQTGDDSPYRFFKENFVRVVDDMFAPNAPGIATAEEVARVILRAATEPNPRARYVAGGSGHVYLFLRRILSDRAWDALMARQFPILAPTRSGA
jgi:NAD(P)-dependent dehydrogenase (short-subunit alcohol dehydrogenase family)